MLEFKGLVAFTRLVFHGNYMVKDLGLMQSALFVVLEGCGDTVWRDESVFVQVVVEIAVLVALEMGRPQPDVELLLV